MPLEIVTELATRWPKAFFVLEARRAPLKVGITEDILATGVPWSREELGSAMRWYVNCLAYQWRSSTANNPRIDLEGNVAGAITDEQAIRAKEYADRLRNQFRNRKAKLKAEKAKVEAEERAKARGRRVLHLPNKLKSSVVVPA
jgi:ProP effector